MTNKEKYKQAFSVLQTSDNYALEVEKMAILKRKQTFKTMAAAVAACVLLVGGSGTAYAADIGGIQRTLQLWIHGDQTNVSVDFHSDGSYEMEYADENGDMIEVGGGGAAILSDGTERPLTEAELTGQLNSPTIEYYDDGSVWLYYYAQKLEITDKFKDNVCYIKLVNGDETLYVTVKYQNGWTTSPYKYQSPNSFN